jgi:hypothetical protein
MVVEQCGGSVPQKSRGEVVDYILFSLTCQVLSVFRSGWMTAITSYIAFAALALCGVRLAFSLQARLCGPRVSEHSYTG